MPDQTQPALAVGQVWRRGKRTRKVLDLVGDGPGGRVVYSTRSEALGDVYRRDFDRWCARATLDAPAKEQDHGT